MTTKNMAYDHPAYQAVLPVSLGVTAAGASAISPARFVAFTNMLVKSITIAKIAAGTSTTFVERALVYRGGTGTETSVLTTLGSTGFANVTTTLTLTQGDALAVLQGSDATETTQSGAELVIIPGANVSS